MKAGSKKEQPVRLSQQELRDSRAGKLGRFPSEDLYEPEREDAKELKAAGQRGVASSETHKRPRE